MQAVSTLLRAVDIVSTLLRAVGRAYVTKGIIISLGV